MRPVVATRAIEMVALLFAVAVNGCTVGPDFYPPRAPAVRGYAPKPLTTQTVSASVGSFTGCGTATFVDTSGKSQSVTLNRCF